MVRVHDSDGVTEVRSCPDIAAAIPASSGSSAGWSSVRWCRPTRSGRLSEAWRRQAR